MRANRFIADSTGVSRREADDMIAEGRVLVNGAPARLGQQLEETDSVTLDGKTLTQQEHKYVMLNKPVGYVCSRAKQDDSPTIYELLPKELESLKTAGRLDKESSGLVLLTNDGEFAFTHTHPKFEKQKEYTVTLDRPMRAEDLEQMAKGVDLTDGISKLIVNPTTDTKVYLVSMHEGRNRQIRRTFGALSYTITALRRDAMGEYKLGDLEEGNFIEVKPL